MLRLSLFLQPSASTHKQRSLEFVSFQFVCWPLHCPSLVSMLFATCFTQYLNTGWQVKACFPMLTWDHKEHWRRGWLFWGVCVYLESQKEAIKRDEMFVRSSGPLLLDFLCSERILIFSTKLWIPRSFLRRFSRDRSEDQYFCMMLRSFSSPRPEVADRLTAEITRIQWTSDKNNLII